MGKVTFGTVGAALAMTIAATAAVGAAASPGASSGTVQYRATATFSDGSSADRLYSVRLDADSDGDGIGDEAWLRVRCDGGAAAAVYYYTVKSPRDAASGQASGKRMHKPFTITKEWGASTPMLGKTGAGAGGGGGGGAIGGKVGWDLAKGKGARVDHSRASDASAGKGAAGDRASYDVKKNEGGKTMAHDDWHEVTLREGAPNLCA